MDDRKIQEKKIELCDCGKPAEHGSVFCKSCLKKIKQYNEEQVALKRDVYPTVERRWGNTVRIPISISNNEKQK